MVTLSQSALDKVKEMIRSDENLQGKALRVFVEGGGCAGMQYGFAFDERRDGDLAQQWDGVEVVVDDRSAPLLEGASIDYIDNPLQGSGFRIENPNARGSCGCGHSFTP